MPTVAVDRSLRLPPDECGTALLAVREDQWFERKSNRIRGQELANALIGFANADGGTLVIGLWNGAVEGVDGGNARMSEWQQAALDFTIPAVPVRRRLIECVRAGGDGDHSHRYRRAGRSR